MRTIAVDDEPLALDLIVEYIGQTPGLSLVQAFLNPAEAMQFMQQNPVDLVFLDIKMPEITGIEIAQQIPESSRLIFTTAFDRYAIDGFKLNAVDYLLKPFSYEEFLNAVNKAAKLFDYEQKTALVEGNKDFLFLKSEYKIRRIRYNEILYIEGLKDYVKVYLKHEIKPILSLASLKSLENKLPPDRFMRVHRSFIVNLEQIEIIERSNIVFNKQYIPVSDQYKEKFQKYLNENFL